MANAIGTAATKIKDGAVALASGFLGLVSRIMNGIKAMPIVLAFGCNAGNDVTPTVPPPPHVPEVAPVVVAEPAPKAANDEQPKPLGKFNITFYYVVGEDEVGAKPVAKNDNAAETELVAVAPPVTLYNGGGSCDPIAEVSQEFAQQLAIQGTGKLRDGRVLNIWGHCACEHSPCFKVMENQWGSAGSGRPLQPFRTVAVDPKVIKLGSLLYVPLLEGRTMPGRAPWGGFVHDGCVVADDTGGHIGGNQLDLFVARKGYYNGLGTSGHEGSHAWARHVDVFDGRGICERKGRVIGKKSASI
jgi:3D (Asp-Asp-Asp) domain-containing protein